MAELLPGYLNLRSVLNDRVSSNGNLIETIETIYRQSIAAHNAIQDALFSMFVTNVTKAQLRFKTPVSARLQPLDEHGKAKPVRMAGYYTVGFPIKRAGIAMGVSGRVARAQLTVQDTNDNLALMLSADNHWMRDQVLAALFTASSYTFSDEKEGDLTILPLANGDSQVYMVRAGSEVGTTANHLRAQATLVDGNQPFTTIYNDLTKRPENAGSKVVTLIATNLQDEVEALTDFIERKDPDVTPGSGSDVLTGSLPAGFPGEYIGKIGRNFIVVWDAIPDGYMVSVATGGEKALAMRQYTEPELQGFQAWSTSDDDLYFEKQFDRFAGFAAWNRVNAIITLIGSGTYAAPSGLSQPLA